MLFELKSNEEDIIVSIVYNDGIFVKNLLDESILISDKIKKIVFDYLSQIDKRYSISNDRLLFYRIEDAELLVGLLNEGFEDEG